MNSKMTTNSQPLTIKSKKKKSQNKNKVSKQLEQEQNHRNGDHRLSRGEWVGREEEKVQRISSINGRQKIDGEGKNSIGNVEPKELTCMTDPWT